MPTKPFPDEMCLDEHALDTAHRDLFDALTRLASLPPAAFSPAFDNCVAGMETDFRTEEELMEGLAPAMVAAHREQHARVLAALHHAAAALAQGDAEPAHRAVWLLAEWLPLHIGTFDRTLADMAREARGQQSAALAHPATAS